MNLKKLDEIVSEYCKNIGIFKDTIEQVYPMAVSVVKTTNPNIEKLEWSRKFSLTDSIKFVYMFLNDIDHNLASEFIAKINNPNIVKIQSRKDNPDGYDCVDGDGIVHIFYENTPNDIFIICHEMLHKLNEQEKNEQNNCENLTRDYFGETVSIMGEMLIGNYLIENGIMNENDLNMRKLKRLNGDRENARDIIIESNLISLKMAGKEINYENLIQLINECKDESIKKILIDESLDFKRIESIFRNYEEYKNKRKNLVDVLNIRKSQRYVIAEYLTQEFISKESRYDDFLQLHYAVADKNSSINDIVDDIRKKHPTL